MDLTREGYVTLEMIRQRLHHTALTWQPFPAELVLTHKQWVVLENEAAICDLMDFLRLTIAGIPVRVVADE